jgi:transketolase
MFEDLGLKYIGPVDGHDIETMESALRRARAFGGPVIVHAVTTKGFGYPPAETDQIDAWHATGIFDPDSGASTAAARDWTAAFSDELVRIGAERSDVVAITAAMLHPTGLAPFAERFPERTFDVGIAEQHALTSAAGLALGGMHPVVAVYSTFLNRAFDQLLMDVALHRQPVTLVLDRAGVTGDDGASHNGMWDMSVLSVVPGLRLAAPRDETTLREALREAVDIADGPSVVRFPKGSLPPDVPAVERRGRSTSCAAAPWAGWGPALCCWSPSARWCRWRWPPRSVPTTTASRSPSSTRAGCCRCRRRCSTWRSGSGWSSRWRTAAGPAASAPRSPVRCRTATATSPSGCSACRSSSSSRAAVARCWPTPG